MRTFDDFWNHPTPDDDALRRAALNSVARAQGDDFANWYEFTTWDLGPGGARISRALFDIVEAVFKGVYPLIARDEVLNRVIAERRKQIERGHDAEHDDGHDRAELVMAALSYVLPFHMRGSGDEHMVYGNDAKPEEWPFDRRSWRPSPLDRKKELVKAMALLVAEYEHLERQGP